ncbi:unnamed protein product [Symbiodinium sp. CCMP2592]|nr:unnamed protein product [Symbiodinium sp. CCMP2592]
MCKACPAAAIKQAIEANHGLFWYPEQNVELACCNFAGLLRELFKLGKTLLPKETQKEMERFNTLHCNKLLDDKRTSRNQGTFLFVFDCSYLLVFFPLKRSCWVGLQVSSKPNFAIWEEVNPDLDACAASWIFDINAVGGALRLCACSYRKYVLSRWSDEKWIVAKGDAVCAEIQVLEQGSLRGCREPSAGCIGRIAKAQRSAHVAEDALQAPSTDELSAFAEQNSIGASCCAKSRAGPGKPPGLSRSWCRLRRPDQEGRDLIDVMTPDKAFSLPLLLARQRRQTLKWLKASWIQVSLVASGKMSEAGAPTSWAVWRRSINTADFFTSKDACMVQFDSSRETWFLPSSHWTNDTGPTRPRGQSVDLFANVCIERAELSRSQTRMAQA